MSPLKHDLDISTETKAARLEIYKFVMPVLLLLLGGLMGLQLNSINGNAHDTNVKMDVLSTSVASMAAQIIDIQRNVQYNRDDINKLKDRRSP